MCPDKTREKRRIPLPEYIHTRTYYAWDVYVYDYDETVHRRRKDTKEGTITIQAEIRRLGFLGCY
jgi:hypothetical protein